jgi:hypothetical protein
MLIIITIEALAILAILVYLRYTYQHESRFYFILLQAVLKMLVPTRTNRSHRYDCV